jgi:DNA (cytosine-5)-methyltransferase 3A
MKYYASEIDKYAIKVTQNNFPNTWQLGDVKKIDTLMNTKGGTATVDLLVGGSPCQDVSFAGLGKGLIHGERSNLFFEYVRLLNKLKPKYFLLENVRMKQEYQDIISSELGVKPYIYNSADCSAQNRLRWYWTNIPQDELIRQDNIVLQDILEDDGIAHDLMTNKEGKAHCVTARYNGAVWWNSIQRKQRTMVQVAEADTIKGYDIIKRIYSPMGKSPTLTTMQGGHREPKVAMGRIVNRRLDENGTRKDNQLDLPFTTKLEVRQDDKSNCLTTVQKDNVVTDGMRWRKLTPLECERLQGVPDNYTDCVSNSQRYKMLGNGFNVPTIKHILKNLPDIHHDFTTLSLFDGYSGCQIALRQLQQEREEQRTTEWVEMYNNNKENV